MERPEIWEKADSGENGKIMGKSGKSLESMSGIANCPW